ncbi:MAG: response regulator [Spirochaetales bacterium]|nr:response regulator [Spirochaetales bacterium]
MELTQLETILLIEDNEDHVEHTIDALREGNVVRSIIVQKDGDSAVKYLLRKDAWEDPKKSPRPNLILLDVKLPGKNGFEILEIVKNNPDLKTIPVILLTTTGNKEDIELGARLGANDYIIKPVDFDSFVGKVKGLGKYWALVSNMAGN